MNQGELVTLFDGNPVTTSLVLAEGTDVQHKNVIGLVRKYADDLAEFGSLAFQTRVMRKDGRGGEPTEFAYLNEPQSTLLMTYMSNTPIIRAFKKRLVAAFFDLAAGKALAIQNMPQSPVTTKVTVNTSDLVREANKGNRFVQRLLHHLTGMQVDDLAAEIEHKLVVEDFRRSDLAAQYLDLALASAVAVPGLERGTTPDGRPWLQAIPTTLFNLFQTIGKQHNLPLLARDVIAFGAILSREAAGLEFYGWKRTLAKTSHGRRYFRFERTGGEA